MLDGTEGLIRVFLYADIKVREERVRERNLYADKDVLKNIHRIDRERRDYNRYYAGRDLGETGELRPFDQYDADWCGRGGSVD